MTTVIFNEPPAPPAGEQWCPMCLMIAKWFQLESDPDWTKYPGDGQRGKHIIPWPEDVTLWTARYRAVSDISHLGLVEVCWQHVAGLQRGHG